MIEQVTTWGLNSITLQWKNHLQSKGQIHNNMVTGKRHKTDLKTPILLCMFLCQYLDFLNNKLATASPLSKMLWVIYIFHVFIMA